MIDVGGSGGQALAANEEHGPATRVDTRVEMLIQEKTPDPFLSLMAELIRRWQVYCKVGGVYITPETL